LVSVFIQDLSLVGCGVVVLSLSVSGS
jgi:hypothetical protein